MASEIVLGTANTAPFSGWSYGMFISKILPILLITLLFFVSFLYSGQEQEVRTITDTTPIDPQRYGLLRCGAMIAGFLCIAAASMGASLFFYAVNFKFTDFTPFILPALITLLPGMLFILGLSIVAGRLHHALLYALMPLVLLFGYIPLPNAIDLFGNHLFQRLPAVLPLGADGEPAFVIPAAVWLGKAAYSVVGVGLTIWGLTRQKTKTGQFQITKAGI